MDVIDLSKKKREKKHTGRFKVTIKTIESPSSIFVQYLITVEDFYSEGYVSIKSKTYTGSNPRKEAEKIIEQIKRQEKHTKKTESYYVD